MFLERTQEGVLKKWDQLHSRYVTNSITALRRTRWRDPKMEGECCRGMWWRKVIEDDDIIADGELVKLDHLDVVLKQLVRFCQVR